MVLCIFTNTKNIAMLFMVIEKIKTPMQSIFMINPEIQFINFFVTVSNGNCSLLHDLSCDIFECI